MGAGGLGGGRTHLSPAAGAMRGWKGVGMRRGRAQVQLAAQLPPFSWMPFQTFQAPRLERLSVPLRLRSFTHTNLYLLLCGREHSFG